MLIQESKIHKSLFIDRYSTYLKVWCNRLEDGNATIFAISRKGPRLIELLVREGYLNKAVLNRVITEHAIPFYNFSKNEEIILIDDSVQHGSTFKRITRLIKKEAELQDCKVNIIGLPFASSLDIPEPNKDIIEKVYYPLNKDEINSFINCQISSFRLLGKPYDIEHPIFTIRGNFNDEIILETALKDFVSKIANKSGKELFLSDNEEQISIKNNESLLQKKYFIIIKNENDRISSEAEFSKIRIFINPEKNILSIVPIRPVAISNEILKNFANLLPTYYKNIWNKVVFNIQSADKHNNDILYEAERSQIVFANYLCSYFLLKDFYKDLHQVFNDYYIDIFFEGFSAFDLQYILGIVIGKEIANELQNLLTAPGFFEVAKVGNNIFYEDIQEALYPIESIDGYDTFLNEQLPLCHTSYEILSYIFYAQHLKIEVPSRLNTDILDDRLRFGVTLKYLFDKVHFYLPNEDNLLIHEALDNLIDFGTIVPKYINVSKKINKNIWLRVFRVGEGSSIKKIHTLIYLVEELLKKLKKDEIPAVLLEKFCVLALTGDFPILELKGLEELKITKGFGLYGARAQLKLQNNIINFLDFGETHKILERKGTKYSLNKNIRDTFKITDLHLTRLERRRITDTAALCVHLYNLKNLQTKSLVTITTLTSEDDYFLALSAELDIWLHHSVYNIFNCLTELRSIIQIDDTIEREEDESKKLNLLNLKKKRLEEIDNLLSKNANITAQVRDKTEYYSEREETFKEISTSVQEQNDTIIERVWEDFSDIISNQKFNSRKVSSGLNEILSALRLAHRITSILRNLLSSAGFTHSKYPYKPSDLRSSVERLIETLGVALKAEFRISNAAFQIFQNNKNQVNISEQIKIILNTINEETSFRVMVNLLTPILHSISENCELLLNEYGSKDELKPSNLYPPQYVLLWDVKGSTGISDRTKDLEQAFVQTINDRIKSTFSDKVRNFKPDMNDGNGFVSDDFSVIAATFEIMYEVAIRQNIILRAGCDVNYQGELHYYPSTNTIGGRGYEFAARVCNFFKEINVNTWSGETLEEPVWCYLVVSELAQRIAQTNKQWFFSEQFQENKLNGLYAPRIKSGTSFPFIIHLIESKSNQIATV